MTEQKNPKTWKKIIDLIIVVLTAIGSFIGGNISAKNADFEINEMSNQKVEVNE